MPTSLNYGSTGRPPGKFHLRHSFRENSDNLKFSQPPLHIFSIEMNANNKYSNICRPNDGGNQTTTVNYNTSTYDDNKEADTAHSIHRTDKKKRFHLTFNNNNIDTTSNNNNNKHINYYNNNGVIVGVAYEDEDTGSDYNTSTISKVDEETAPNSNRRMASNDTILPIDLISSSNNNINYNNSSIDTSITTSTTTSNTNNKDDYIESDTSPYDDNNKADTAHSIHRTDKTIQWFDISKNNKDLLSNNNNNNNMNNNNSTAFDTSPSHHNTSTYDDNKDANSAHRIHRTDKTILKRSSDDDTSRVSKRFKLIPKSNKSIPTSTSNTISFTPTTINYDTSTYDDNKEADAAHSIHRTDTVTEWFGSIPNNNNNKKNNNSNSIEFDTSLINYNTSTYDDNNKANIIAHSIHRTDKTSEWFVISNYLIIIKSSSPKDLKATPHHHQQQHYHCKQRHQFHLEQQQKHQLFKQVYNAERMVTSILLKLTLVAWDIWAFRNVY